MSLHVVLVHPEIHWNTGNVGRTCLATGAELHLIEPLGFSLNDREVRRAGLDYWEHVPLHVWPSWKSFEERLPELGEPFLFSTKGKKPLWEADYGRRTVLIFGSETAGLPADLRQRFAGRMFRMPIHSPHVRSLNLSTAAAIAMYEVLRHRGDAALSAPLS